MTVEQKIKELGLEIPVPGTPIGSFVTAMRSGDMIYVSGNTSILRGKTGYTGKLGDTVTVEEGRKAARLAGLRCIGALQSVANLDKIRILEVIGFINAVPEFTEHPAVLNGASDLFVNVFGENGKHARCAIGVASLPGRASVEITLTAKVLP